MNNLVRADLYAARKSTGLRVTLLYSAAMMIIYAIVSYSLATGALDVGTNSAVSMASDPLTSAIALSLVAAIVVSQSFDSKSIHDAVLVAPRTTIVISKVMSYSLIGTVILSPWILFSLVAFIVGWDLGMLFPTTLWSVASNAAGSDVTVVSVLASAGMLIVGVLVYLSMYVPCVLLAFMVRRQVVVVVSGILIGFFGGYFTHKFSQIGVIGWIAELIPYHPSHDGLTVASSNADIAGTIAVAVTFAAVVTLILAAIFRRTDLK